MTDGLCPCPAIRGPQGRRGPLGPRGPRGNFATEGDAPSDFVYSTGSEWVAGSSVVRLGIHAGMDTVQDGVAMGENAGHILQADHALACGSGAGSSGQGDSGVGIGAASGELGQGAAGVAVGLSAGEGSQGGQAVAVGPFAGMESQGSQSVALGGFGFTTVIVQAADAVAIGNEAVGRQEDGSVCIGGHGSVDQGQLSVRVGKGINDISQQGANTVSAGFAAGSRIQSLGSTALGTLAAHITQSPLSVAVGPAAAAINQGPYAVAVGLFAGGRDQGTGSVCIGYPNQPGIAQNEGGGSLTIGHLATCSAPAPLDSYSIAIGTGATVPVVNSIVMHAFDSVLTTSASAVWYASPIRTVTSIVGLRPLYVNLPTAEVVHAE